MSEMMERNKEVEAALRTLTYAAIAAMCSPWDHGCDGITHLYWVQLAASAAAFAELAARAAKAEAMHTIMERGDPELVNRLGIYIKKEDET